MQALFDENALKSNLSFGEYNGKFATIIKDTIISIIEEQSIFLNILLIIRKWTKKETTITLNKIKYETLNNTT